MVEPAPHPVEHVRPTEKDDLAQPGPALEDGLAGLVHRGAHVVRGLHHLGRCGLPEENKNRLCSKTCGVDILTLKIKKDQAKIEGFYS